MAWETVCRRSTLPCAVCTENLCATIPEHELWGVTALARSVPSPQPCPLPCDPHSFRQEGSVEPTPGLSLDHALVWPMAKGHGIAVRSGQRDHTGLYNV